MNGKYFYISLLTVFLQIPVILIHAANNSAINVEYEIYDNVVVWGCDYYNNTKGIKINIKKVTGGNGNYTISTSGNGMAMPNSISSGEGFVYFFTENDLTNNTIGFTISDGQSTIQLDPLLTFVLNSLSITFNCGAPPKCMQNYITHTQNDIISTDVYQVRNKITSSGTIPERLTSYFAVKEIALEIGFEVKLISTFTAEIKDPCQ